MAKLLSSSAVILSAGFSCYLITDIMSSMLDTGMFKCGCQCISVFVIIQYVKISQWLQWLVAVTTTNRNLVGCHRLVLK